MDEESGSDPPLLVPSESGPSDGKRDGSGWKEKPLSVQWRWSDHQEVTVQGSEINETCGWGTGQLLTLVGHRSNERNGLYHSKGPRFPVLPCFWVSC